MVFSCIELARARAVEIEASLSRLCPATCPISSMASYSQIKHKCKFSEAEPAGQGFEMEARKPVADRKFRSTLNL